MRDENRAFYKIFYLRNNLFFARGVFNHVIGDPRHLGDLFRDGPAGIDEEIDRIDDHSLFKAGGAELDDAVIFRREAGRFKVEADIGGIMQRDIAGIIDIFEIVIHHIKLGTINHLDALGFGFFLSIRIALNDAVIGDGDGFVAH